MELSPQWLVNGGLRLDRYETKFTNTPANNYTVIKRNDTLWNYQLGLVYKPADNGSIYVSYATSSTPSNSDSGEGAGNGLAPGRGGAGANAADMAPEKNKTYELGTKWEVLDRRMTLTAAVFRTETTNARLTLPDNTYAMAGKKQVDGFELGFGQHYAGLAGLRRLHLPEEQDQGRRRRHGQGQRLPQHTAQRLQHLEHLRGDAGLHGRRRSLLRGQAVR